MRLKITALPGLTPRVCSGRSWLRGSTSIVDVRGVYYHGCMVDSALLERVMQLDERSRLELRDAIEASVASPLSPKTQALLEERVAQDDDAGWEDYATLEEDEIEMRARRRVA